MTAKPATTERKWCGSPHALHPMWEMSEADRRRSIQKRAAKGARKTRTEAAAR